MRIYDTYLYIYDRYMSALTEAKQGTWVTLALKRRILALLTHE